jgi:hypothetical protein
VKFLVGSPTTVASSSLTTCIPIPQDAQKQLQSRGLRTISIGEESTTTGGSSAGSSTVNATVRTAQPQRKDKQQTQELQESTSRQEQPQQPLPQMDNAKRRLLMDPFIHQSLYTPKRSVSEDKFPSLILMKVTNKTIQIFGTQSGAYSQVSNDISDALLAEQAATVAVDGLVRTTFVDWCGKTWTGSTKN